MFLDEVFFASIPWSHDPRPRIFGSSPHRWWSQFKYGHCINRTYLTQIIVLFKIRNRPYLKKNLTWKTDFISLGTKRPSWVGKESTAWVRHDWWLNHRWLTGFHNASQKFDNVRMWFQLLHCFQFFHEISFVRLGSVSWNKSNRPQKINLPPLLISKM